MALTAPQPIPFLNRLLAKAIIKRAKTQSVAAAHAEGTIKYNWSLYVIKVLEAPPAMRALVKEAAEESESIGCVQLAGMLTLFEVLTPQRKIDLIDAFKGTTTVQGQGQVAVATHSAHQPGHIPPRYEP